MSTEAKKILACNLQNLHLAYTAAMRIDERSQGVWQ